SEMMTLGAMLPGDPVSIASDARNAPLIPATLKVVIVGSGRMALPRPALLSNVNPVVASPKLTPVIRFPFASNKFTASPEVLRPTREPPYAPIKTPLGGVLTPNQASEKLAMSAASVVPVAVPSIKTADFPAGMLVTPRSATAEPNEFELSSIFQPVMSTALLL